MKSVGSVFNQSITYSSGSIFAFIVTNKNFNETKYNFEEPIDPIKTENILVSSTVLEDHDVLNGAKLVIQTLRGVALRPNFIILTLGNDEQKDDIVRELLNHANNNELGSLILRQHKRAAFGLQKDINLWLRDKSPNWHLAVLLSLQLQLNWGGKINLVAVAEFPQDER